jgi:hypothetical protein
MSQQTTPRPKPEPRLPDPFVPSRPRPRKRRLWLWISLGVLIPLLAGAITWLAPHIDTTVAPAGHTVIYNAEGEGARGIRTASYTIETLNGSEQGVTNLPLKAKNGSTGLTLPGFKTGAFVYLSVQNRDASGSVTCRITVDGYVVSENTSVGGYTIATCKGRVP